MSTDRASNRCLRPISPTLSVPPRPRSSFSNRDKKETA
jgi:hypothetical protein